MRCAVARALEHVFGYTIVNDVTARDRQVRRKPDGSTWYELGRGKLFDGFLKLRPRCEAGTADCDIARCCQPASCAANGSGNGCSWAYGSSF